MNIDNDILITWGAKLQKYCKNEMIFFEGDYPQYYHQIEYGKVKMFNTYEDGKEFIQGHFIPGDSFGEPVIFINETYPAHAVALEDSVVIKMKLDKFFNLLDAYPIIYKKFVQIFARRIYNKSNTVREVINNSPEMRLLGFLISFKKSNGFSTDRIMIPFTRQELANFTGLRVETVIRTLNKMKKMNKVDIIERKLYF